MLQFSVILCCDDSFVLDVACCTVRVSYFVRDFAHFCFRVEFLMYDTLCVGLLMLDFACKFFHV